MMFDWQNIFVALIICGALAYVARRAYARLRTFRAGQAGSAAACETGCGSCGADRNKTSTQPPTFIKIERTRTRRASR